MPPLPPNPRAVTFIDGQNLFRAVLSAFKYTFPNYDVRALSEALCKIRGWSLAEVRFYTGVPDQADDPLWHGFWTNKLRAMKSQGVVTFHRSLRYGMRDFRCPKCGVKYQCPKCKAESVVRVGREKGIDIRMALDIIQGGLANRYDVALLMTQDQDFSEVADEIRSIAKAQNRWIKIASAFPAGAGSSKGVDRTDWIPIDLATYLKCIDPRDHRSRPIP